MSFSAGKLRAHFKLQRNRRLAGSVVKLPKSAQSKCSLFFLPFQRSSETFSRSATSEHSTMGLTVGWRQCLLLWISRQASYLEWPISASASELLSTHIVQIRH